MTITAGLMRVRHIIVRVTPTVVPDNPQGIVKTLEIYWMKSVQHGGVAAKNIRDQ